MDAQTRFIDIPEPVQEMYKIYRPSPLIRAYELERALDTPARIYYKFEGHAPDYLEEELKACADMVDMLDAKMFSLNEAIMKISEDEKAAETAAAKE